MFSISVWDFLFFYFAGIFFIAILGILGKETGFRRLYVKILLKIFEWGRVKIERAMKRKSSQDEELEELDLGSGGNSAEGKQIISREETLMLAPGARRNTNDDKLFPADEQGAGDGLRCNGKVPRDDEVKFSLAHALDFVKAGVEAIIQDEVTKRFDAAELTSWNLLTRTNQNYEFLSVRLTLIWFFGFIFRYVVLFPFRVILTIIGVLWLSGATLVIGVVSDKALKKRLYEFVSLATFRIFGRALSAIITYHNLENRPTGGICVANHTSPIDIVMLHCDNVYSLVGQRHGGFLGILQKGLIRASDHLWFERTELKDRKIVAARMKEHVEDPNTAPILIFPEGTCINNTSVMQFKKGSFEIDAEIFPVAIKYKPEFGDAFWNSSRYNYMQYLAHMLSSWATVVDVYYLPPMKRQKGEDAIDFANRVKSEIARKGGLVDLAWDGQLKRMQAKQEWKEQQQKLFVDRLKSE